MSAQTKLLVIEPIILSDWQDFLSKFPDLMILVITEGGRERTEEEFRTLFAASDLKLTNVVNTGSRVGIVEAVQV